MYETAFISLPFIHKIKKLVPASKTFIGTIIKNVQILHNGINLTKEECGQTKSQVKLHFSLMCKLFNGTKD